MSYSISPIVRDIGNRFSHTCSLIWTSGSRSQLQVEPKSHRLDFLREELPIGIEAVMVIHQEAEAATRSLSRPLDPRRRHWH